ncbi:MAG: hypothetical protein M3552_10350, partial [Planctomycetota bacterium]|nr:hypothetical protein [Planctomycetota bacterium]
TFDHRTRPRVGILKMACEQVKERPERRIDRPGTGNRYMTTDFYRNQLHRNQLLVTRNHPLPASNRRPL